MTGHQHDALTLLRLTSTGSQRFFTGVMRVSFGFVARFFLPCLSLFILSACASKNSPTAKYKPALVSFKREFPFVAINENVKQRPGGYAEAPDRIIPGSVLRANTGSDVKTFHFESSRSGRFSDYYGNRGAFTGHYEKINKTEALLTSNWTTSLGKKGQSSVEMLFTTGSRGYFIATETTADGEKTVIKGRFSIKPPIADSEEVAGTVTPAAGPLPPLPTSAAIPSPTPLGLPSPTPVATPTPRPTPTPVTPGYPR